MGIAGIVAPTSSEAGMLLKNILDEANSVIQGKLFCSGFLNGVAVALSICGIGKANAAHAAAILFERYNPSQVFVIGVAGAYPSSGLDVGDVAVAEKEIYGDEGLLTADGLLTMDRLGLSMASRDGAYYYNEFPLFIPASLEGYKHTGAFVTVSACTGLMKNGLETAGRFNAICENMEGAAIAHIGLLNNIPVTEIRGVSNIIEDRQGALLDKAAIGLAARNAQRFFMETIIPDLSMENITKP